MPRLAYPKLGVTLELAQKWFVCSIGDYGTGVFYESFATTTELQTPCAC